MNDNATPSGGSKQELSKVDQKQKEKPDSSPSAEKGSTNEIIAVRNSLTH